MDSGRATVRNMRSKCRCSCVLQFTFRHAVNCVLHRPPSQVIHCIVLYFSHFQTKVCLRFQKRTTFIQYPHGEGHKRNPGKGEDSLDGFSNLLTATESPLDRKQRTVPKTRARGRVRPSLDSFTTASTRLRPRADVLKARGKMNFPRVFSKLEFQS